MRSATTSSESATTAVAYIPVAKLDAETCAVIRRRSRRYLWKAAETVARRPSVSGLILQLNPTLPATRSLTAMRPISSLPENVRALVNFGRRMMLGRLTGADFLLVLFFRACFAGFARPAFFMFCLLLTMCDDSRVAWLGLREYP